MKKCQVAVVGASGAVGREMLKILEERRFPLAGIKLVASHRSAGKTLPFRGQGEVIEDLEKFSFQGIDIVFSSPGTKVSKQYVPRAVKEGAVVIDNTNAFRMQKDVPLVVPEVNAEEIPRHRGIIANPNCSTIQMVVALKPIHAAARIKRVVVSSYQSVSGAGFNEMEELREQTRDLLEGKEARPARFPQQIAFNVIPQIPQKDAFHPNFYTEEEMRMVRETKKIMGDDSIRVTATCVRVPVYIAHSESINVETERKLTRREVIRLLSQAPGVKVIDDPENQRYPLPVDAAGRDEVFVGRIREDESADNALNLWVVGDNLRKGAALNAVQIGERLIAHA